MQIADDGMIYFFVAIGASWLLFFARPLWLNIFSRKRSPPYHRVWAVDGGIALMAASMTGVVIIFQNTATSPEVAVLAMVVVISILALWICRAAIHEYRINQ
jgi:hypothetical protein